MDKKIVLITGGSRGLGSKMVERFSFTAGNTVYFTYACSDGKAAEMESRYKRAIPVKCDQRYEDQVKNCLKRISAEQGRLDVLVNNACPNFMPRELSKMDWGLFQEILDVNVKGAYCFMKESIEIMKKNGGGRIINILSSYVLNIPPEKLSHYITAKYALLGLSKSAAVELVKYGITVNMVSPGLMPTDLSSYLPRKYLEFYSDRNPMKRLTTTEDAVNIIEFLASDSAAFLNGVNIPVNGGESFY